VEAAATIPEPEQVILKRMDRYRIIGQPLLPLDAPEKIKGSAIFGIDVQVPGMLNATVVHAPVFGARMAGFDAAVAGRMPGVKKVSAIASGVAVVADTFWQARTAAETVRIQWEQAHREGVSSDALRERWIGLCGTKGESVHRLGDPERAFGIAARTIQAIYELPFQAHATPEPMNCKAHVKRDSCEICAPTQNQDSAQEAAARITGLGYARGGGAHCSQGRPPYGDRRIGSATHRPGRGERLFCGNGPAHAQVSPILLIGNPDLSAQHGLSQDFSAIRDRNHLYAIIERVATLAGVHHPKPVQLEVFDDHVH